MSNSRGSRTYSKFSTSTLDMFCKNPKESTFASIASMSNKTYADDSLEKPFLFHLDTKNNG